MHSNIFVVPGFGLPKDILLDDIYRKYLSLVFRTILSVKNTHKVIIVFTGGNTDFYPPFIRTEGREMKKLFISMYKENKFTFRYRLFSENKSLSSLDNHLYTAAVLKKNGISGSYFVFCERTRQKRITYIAHQIYGPKIKMIPVDIYSEKQLENKNLMLKKEMKALEFTKWALLSKRNLQKYRKIYKEKMDILRHTPENKREEKILELYKKFIAQVHRDGLALPQG